MLAVGKITGVSKTIADLKKVEPLLTEVEMVEVYQGAKAAAAALRASVPNKPLSNMQGGPIRASVKRGGGLHYRDVPDSHRLVDVRLTGPVMAVISDMAAIPRTTTMVQNLTARYGGASRWVWPTVERFIPLFNAQILLAARKTEVAINVKLRSVR